MEQVENIKDIIIIAGENKADIDWLRQHLNQEGYSVISSQTARELIAELEILPVCSMSVLLVIIEAKMLINPRDDLITQLSECAPDVPFVLYDRANILPSVEELLSGSTKHLMTTGSELSQCIFGTQCIKILEFAEAELLNLDQATADAQTVLTMSSAVIEIADLAARMVKPEVKALADEAIDLLEDIQLKRQCIMSDAHKESLFALINDIKRHALNGNETLTTNN